MLLYSWYVSIQLWQNKDYHCYDFIFGVSVPAGLGRVGGDIVEDVDEHQEQGDQQSHPT